MLINDEMLHCVKFRISTSAIKKIGELMHLLTRTTLKPKLDTLNDMEMFFLKANAMLMQGRSSTAERDLPSNCHTK